MYVRIVPVGLTSMSESKRICLQCRKNTAPHEDDGAQLCDECFEKETDAGGDPFALEEYLLNQLEKNGDKCES